MPHRGIGKVHREQYVTLQIKGDAKDAAESNFDLMQDIKYCLLKEIREMRDHCECRVQECNRSFIKKAHPKVPLSWIGLIGAVFLVVLGIDIGFLNSRLIEFLLKAVL